ncbi:MAG: DNA polymerase/3'-5' exonuclease PolX [Chloroflexi bacterium]|nr:DNA polymerase/3'-5' exonuclease PolX [Chloroflexota bacterium]
MATRNQEVARLLEHIADLLEIKGEQAFRVNAYRAAARRIEGLQQDVEDLFLEHHLRTIPGVGEALEQKIGEYLATGQLEYYERLKREFPPGLVALLAVPGLGPRKARAIYDHLGVANLEQLERALEEGRVRDLPGMGEKTEQNLLRELHRLKQRTTRQSLGLALPLAEDLVALLARQAPVERVSYAGSLRRARETIGDLDLLASGRDPEAIAEAFVGLPMVVEVLSRGPARCSVLAPGGQQVDLRIVDRASWGAALQYFTGSKAHNVRLRELAVRRGWKLNEYGLFDEQSGKRLDDGDEASIYHCLGLSWIPPELREDEGEIEAARVGALPHLVELADIQGDLHTHTDWTDGAHSLEEMAEAARARGYAYLAVTDHSKSLGVARGLNAARLMEQRRLVDRLNHTLAPFRVLLGTEMDIKRDGGLDFDDATLERLDYVSASIHSGMSQGEAQMTERILRALRNPHVAVLNHPRGRLIQRREAYEVDLEAVIRTAAACGVALEVNGQPNRLDLDGHWARQAREAGVRLAINTDAHATSQLELMRYGVATARRGWVERKDVLNALPLDELLATLRRKRGAEC